MRLLLKLRSSINSPYDGEYHYRLQGFIYNLIKTSTEYSYLHDKNGYKFFCFSNIFPYSQLIKKDEVRNLIICSPDNKFLDLINSSINSFKNGIKIGKMEFSIISTEKRDILIPTGKPYSLITGTPIIMRIHKNRISTPEHILSKNYRYYYWKRDLPIELFITQLENTLIKKYHEYCKLKNISLTRDIKPLHFFERFRFKKQVSTKINMKNSSHKVIGTLWQFDFEGWGNNKMIEFALNAGLGERNSLGFGFMNISK